MRHCNNNNKQSIERLSGRRSGTSAPIPVCPLYCQWAAGRTCARVSAGWPMSLWCCGSNHGCIGYAACCHFNSPQPLSSSIYSLSVRCHACHLKKDDEAGQHSQTMTNGRARRQYRAASRTHPLGRERREMISRHLGGGRRLRVLEEVEVRRVGGV